MREIFDGPFGYELFCMYLIKDVPELNVFTFIEQEYNQIN